VVAREPALGIGFTVRQHPGSVQLGASARDEAVRLARGFAQAFSVDVWYVERGTYRLLEAYRPRPARPARSHADAV
jgi:hypothetical protein